MKLLQELLESEMKTEGMKLGKKPTPTELRTIRKFGDWCQGRGDLWHPAFPEKFTDCATRFLKGADENILYKIGEFFSDHLHSFSTDPMIVFIAYAKEVPMPEMDDETGDIDEEAIETYCKHAIEWMYPLNKHKDILPD